MAQYIHTSVLGKKLEKIHAPKAFVDLIRHEILKFPETVQASLGDIVNYIRCEKKADIISERDNVIEDGSAYAQDQRVVIETLEALGTKHAEAVALLRSFEAKIRNAFDKSEGLFMPAEFTLDNDKGAGLGH